MSIIYCDNCQRSIDTDYDLHEECGMSNMKNYYTKDNGELDLVRYYQDLLKHDPGYSEFLDRLNAKTNEVKANESDDQKTRR